MQGANPYPQYHKEIGGIDFPQTKHIKLCRIGESSIFEEPVLRAVIASGPSAEPKGLRQYEYYVRKGNLIAVME